MRSSARSLILLVAFLLGGLVAPVLHGVEHALKAPLAASEATAPVPQDVASGLLGAKAAADWDLVCHLCLLLFAGFAALGLVLALIRRISSAHLGAMVWPERARPFAPHIRAPPVWC